jgi:hypothetical protein
VQREVAEGIRRCDSAGQSRVVAVAAALPAFIGRRKKVVGPQLGRLLGQRPNTTGSVWYGEKEKKVGWKLNFGPKASGLRKKLILNFDSTDLSSNQGVLKLFKQSFGLKTKEIKIKLISGNFSKI